jgi:hypothetical protein
MGTRHVSSVGRAPSLKKGVTGSIPVYDSSPRGLTSEAEISKHTAQDFNAQIATLKAASKAIVMLTAAEMQSGLPLLSADSRADGCYPEGSPAPAPSSFEQSIKRQTHSKGLKGTIERMMARGIEPTPELRAYLEQSRSTSAPSPILYGTHAMQGFKR